MSESTAFGLGVFLGIILMVVGMAAKIEAAAASLTTSLVWETECVPVEMRAGTRFAPDMSPVPMVRNLAGDNVHSATSPLRSLGCFSSFCRATYAKMARRSVVAPAESPIPRPRP